MVCFNACWQSPTATANSCLYSNQLHDHCYRYYHYYRGLGEIILRYCPEWNANINNERRNLFKTFLGYWIFTQFIIPSVLQDREKTFDKMSYNDDVNVEQEDHTICR